MYHDPEWNPVSAERLKQLEAEEQREVMERWFRSRFEDPVEHMPYEGREGGYIWIWGGPFDAEEELQDEFHDLVDEKVIAELASDLFDECWQWAPTAESLGDDYFRGAVAYSLPYRDFSQRLHQLSDLAGVACPENLRQAQWQVVSAAGISALEAYLVERAVRGVRQDPEALRRFVESHGSFKEHKIPVAEVLKMASGIEEYVSGVLTSMVWHRLDRVRRVLRGIFALDTFPDTSQLEPVIRARHDIVHRAGRDRDGNPVEINEEEVRRQLGVISDFVDDLEDLLPEDDEGG